MNATALASRPSAGGSIAPLCPGCGVRKVSHSFEKEGAAYYGCRACGLTFIWPRPDGKALAIRYEDYGRRYYSLGGLRDYLLSPDHYRREVELLQRTSKGGTLLDVGCSVGGFVKAAGDLGYDAQGIDISNASVSVGRGAGLRVVAGDFLLCDFPGGIDVVAMWATLEHVSEPTRYVTRALELLRPGGILLASVPNYSGITQRLIGRRDRYVVIDHLNYWSAGNFAAYIEGFGLEILETVTFGFNPVTLVRDSLSLERRADCGRLAAEQARSGALKRTWVGRVHRVAERMLDIVSLGDVVAVAARRRS